MAETSDQSRLRDDHAPSRTRLKLLRDDGVRQSRSVDEECRVFTIISMAIALAAAAFGYLQARSFVQGKLRFVDAVHHFAVPLLAGLAAMLIASPVVWLLPLIGKGTAILFGLGVGAGVSSGARDIRKRIGSGTI
jgi:hypothetical protein